MKSVAHCLAMTQSHISAKDSYIVLPLCTEHCASTKKWENLLWP